MLLGRGGLAGHSEVKVGSFYLILRSTQFNNELYSVPEASAFTDSRLPLAFWMGSEGKGWAFVPWESLSCATVALTHE